MCFLSLVLCDVLVIFSTPTQTENKKRIRNQFVITAETVAPIIFFPLLTLFRKIHQTHNHCIHTCSSRKNPLNKGCLCSFCFLCFERKNGHFVVVAKSRQNRSSSSLPLSASQKHTKKNLLFFLSAASQIWLRVFFLF